MIAFEGICKSYGDTVALHDVSFEVGPGEVFGLLGPNGAGKTTLIRILMDIIRADAGDIRLFGRPHDRDQLDRVGYLPEERGLYKKRKVLEVMTYLGVLKGLGRAEARDRARRWLERMDLVETANWKTERLSKGMGQKIQLASTLLAEPELCVLDEPFSGLDPLNVRLVQELIEERRRNGRTTILSTHQMNMVEALCDRVSLINKGRLMAYGAVADVRRRHSLPEVRVGLNGEPPALDGIESAVPEGDSTWRLRLAEGRTASEILDALVRAGARIDHFEKILAPMEDVFVRVVREQA